MINLKNGEVLISIIVPIYNSETYLNECINSLINQTLKEIEIILINDGSSDGSRKIIEDFKKLDNRIIVVNKENEGVSSARNLGIQLSSGKFIGFVDSDDYINCQMYEKLYYKAKKYNSNLAICRFAIFSKNNKYNEKWNFNYEDVKTAEFILGNMIGAEKEGEFNKLDILMGSTCRCIYDKDIIDKYNISFNKEITMAEDLLFNINYLTKIDKVVLTDEILYYYRNTRNSLSRGYRNDLFLIIKKLTYEIEQALGQDKKIFFQRRLNFAYFRYAIELIRNETKRIRPINYCRYKNIQSIVKYENLDKRLKNINLNKLNIKIKFFYLMFKYRLTSLGVLFWLVRMLKNLLIKKEGIDGQM